MSQPFEHPERVGPYTILSVLGEGGMGVVYEAEQHEPVRRRVALKMMKVGMDTAEVVTRFDAERQALAVMDHPSVAKVFDAGASEEGRPYFVMELVTGAPLTSYCDGRRLTLRERVELLVDVCRGVQHAHQRGLIHRDLKPSNILVTEVDGKPVPKVIDFGIAKATDTTEDEPGVTRAGHMLGTPAYMSPEQGEGGGADLDIRTDVYSLGVILYEVVAGALPFTDEELGKGGLQWLATLLSHDPPRPSARLATLADTQHTIAQLRQTRVETLRRALDGELDWVVMKAMEKERERRYDSAAELARDLENFLKDQPVEARPPSVGYRARKFARRNRVGVTAASVALIALFGGSIAATVGLVRARAAEAEALLEARTSAQVVDFMTDLFAVSNPSEARGNSILARELLDTGAVRIRTELADQPVVQARMMQTIGSTYRSLSLMPEAERLLAGALEIREREFGPDSPEVADVLVELAAVRNAVVSMDGNALAERALGIYERTYGPESLEVASALTAIVEFMGDSSHVARQRRILEIRQRSSGPADELGEGYLNLGASLAFVGKPDSAALLYDRALAIFDSVDHPAQVMVWTNHAILAAGAGLLDSALVLYQRADTVAERFHGPRSVESANVLANSVGIYLEKGDTSGAERVQREAMSRLIERLGPDASNLDWYRFNLGFLLRIQRKWTELGANAEENALYHERLDYGGMAAEIRLDRAAAALKMGDPGWALRLLEELVPIYEENGSHYHLPSAYYIAALAFGAVGDADRADHHFRDALDAIESSEEPMLMSFEQDLVAIPREALLAEVQNAYEAFRGGA